MPANRDRVWRRRLHAAATLSLAFVTIEQTPALGQPDRVDRHAAIYDAHRGRTVIFGGYRQPDYSNQVWSLSLTDTARWDSLAPLGESPTGRFAHSAVYDPGPGRMVVFGGRDGTSADLDETWTLCLADPPGWTRMLPSGKRPGARRHHSATHDPVRDRMLIFGGQGASFFNDTWSLSLGDTARWDSLGVGSYRLGHSAIYDPEADRMIVFGGLFGGPLNDTRQLALGDMVWSQVPTIGTPPSARSGHSAIYDPVGRRMVVFGGSDASGQRLNDVWELSFVASPTWSRLAPLGGPPSGRAYHSAVYDSSRNAMVVFGGNHSGSDLTWALALGPTPSWSRLQPVLAVSEGELRLPTVTVGDTVLVAFTLANTGLQPLHITAIDLPSDELSLSRPPPLRLTWGAAATETLLLVAREPRTARDSLVIHSDDPFAPRKSLALEIDVRGLDFDTRVLGSPPEVPLGASFPVIVTPRSGVRIEGGTLFYRVAGTSDPFDTVPLVALSTDFIGTVPAGAVTERGVEYYVEVENSAFTATQPPGAPSAFDTQAVVPADSFTAVPRPTSGPDFLAGRQIEVEVLLPAGAVFVSGTIHYREGGEEAYETDSVAAGGLLNRPAARIPARLVGSRGVEYWLAVRTLGSDLRFPADPSAPAVVRTRVQNLVEPAAHPGARYRMLAVPLDFGPDFSGSLDAILTDQLGTYDPVRWRTFRYDPNSLQYLELSSASAAWFRPVPGRGFWLISREPHRVDTGPIEGLSSPTAGPYAIVLAPGWNQVGNPFDFPVAWSDVARDSAVIGRPVAFDASLGARGDYADATPALLAPFEGYFVENTGAEPETLWVPPRRALAGAHGHAHAPPADLGPVAGPGAAPAAWERWSLRLGARTDLAADESNELGMHPQAADGPDPLDLREPPSPPGPWVQLAIASRERDWMGGLYRRDLRRSGADGHAWEVELRSATAGEPVTLELRAATALPHDLIVRVFDREQGSMAELDGSPASTRPDVPPGSGSQAAGPPAARYTLLSLGPERAYRLLVLAGTEAYVSRVASRVRVVPARLTLEPAAPNPFRAAARVRFGLPRAAQVTAEIYTVLGERVASLLDRAPFDAGYHALIWDGRTEAGRQAPSGVYLLRLVADGSRLSRRLMLVK